MAKPHENHLCVTLPGRERFFVGSICVSSCRQINRKLCKIETRESPSSLVDGKPFSPIKNDAGPKNRNLRLLGDAEKKNQTRPDAAFPSHPFT